MQSAILELFAKRHSFYDINNLCPLKQSEITEIVKRALELYPSSFNAQSARVVVLFNDNHKRFWHLVEKSLFEATSDDTHHDIKQKIEDFAKGCGTILFYMDKDIVAQTKDKFALYAENIKNWAFQDNAILQFMIWSALANSGVGASLQHYNPLIDGQTAAEFGIPQNWELVAQMPFGGINTIPQAHLAENLEKYIKIKE